MKNSMPKIFYFITIFILFHCLFMNTCIAYEAGTHMWIASEALKLSNNPDLGNQSYVDEIITGSWEADFKVYDPILGWITDTTALTAAELDHFWNPDNGDSLFPYITATAYQKAAEYWELAIATYKKSPKEAYTFLGHIAHLLADMSVPAHVLLDPHIEGDSYETYMEDNYTNWSSSDINIPIKTALSGQDLFYNLAQRAQFFPSDDRLGNRDNTESSWFIGWPENSSDMRVDENENICVEGSEGCHINDEDLKIIGDHLIPLAIEYTASLYNFFYEQVNTPTDNGITITDNIDSPGQVNEHQFIVTTPGVYVIYTRGTTTDTYGKLYDANYNYLSADDDDGELDNFKITYNIILPGTYYVSIKGGSNSNSTGSYILHIDGPGAGSTDDRDDHGMSAWNATPVSVGSVTSGNMNMGGDVDFFRFTAITPGTYAIYTRGTTTDTYGKLYDANYNYLSADDDDGELDNFKITYNIILPGTYYVSIKGGSNSNSTGSYILHIDGPGAGSTDDRDDHGMSAWNATPVSVGSVTSGNMNMGGDVDFFRFTAITPGTYAIYTRGTTTDTYGKLYDANYNYLSADDDDGELDNFKITYNIILPGTYYVSIKGGSNSNSTGSYILHIDGPGAGSTDDRDDHGMSAWNATPVSVGSVTSGNMNMGGDVDFFRFTAITPGIYAIYTRGTTTDTYGKLYDANYNYLSADDDDGELDNFKITYNIILPGTYYVSIKGGSNSNSIGSYILHIDGPGAGSTDDRDDHGMSAWNATPVSVGSVTSGNMDMGGDMDFFRFTAITPGIYAIYTRGTTTDTYGKLYDANYNYLSADDDDGELDNFKITYNIILPGTYYVSIKGGSNSNSIGSYQLYIDGPSDITLTGLNINGASSVNEDSMEIYTATATCSDGSSSTVTPSWNENSEYASINSTGVLTTTSVINNQTVIITASLTYGGVTKTANKTVTIIDASKTLSGLSISGSSFVNEDSSSIYTATALWSDGSTTTVTPAWTENSSYSTITTAGVLTTTSVIGNHTVTITASFTDKNVTQTASQLVTIKDTQSIFDYDISGKVANIEGVSVTLSNDDTTETITTDATGNFIFMHLSNGTYLVTPSKIGYIFKPASRIVTIMNQHQDNIDFAVDLNIFSEYLLLTELSKSFPIPAGARIQITGSTAPSTIVIAAGAQVQFKNFVGGNVIILEEASSKFIVYRSGYTVFLISTEGTILQITPKEMPQSIYFTDGMAELIITGTKVMLGVQEITETDVEVKNCDNIEQPPYTSIYTLPETVNTYLILTDNSVPFNIPYGSYVQVIGSAGPNTINVESDARVDCYNFSGSNVVNIEDATSYFKVYRSGAVVYLESDTGTRIKIPATLTAQTLNFADYIFELIINNNKVTIGNKEILKTEEQL